MRIVERFKRCRRAATAVEYGLILALIVIALVVGLRLLSGATVTLWGNVDNQVATAR